MRRWSQIRNRMRRQLPSLKYSRLATRALRLRDRIENAIRMWEASDQIFPRKVEQVMCYGLLLWVILCVGIWTGVAYANKQNAEIQPASFAGQSAFEVQAQ